MNNNNNRGALVKKRNRARGRKNKVDPVFRLIRHYWGPKWPRKRSANRTFPMWDVKDINATFNTAVQSAATFTLYEIDLSSIWQTLPGGPTGVNSGYTAASATYLVYTVFRALIRYSVLGNDSGTGFNFYWLCSDIRPTTKITTYAQALTTRGLTNVFDNNYVAEIGGMNRYKGSFSVDFTEVVSNMSFLFGGNFSSNMGANPANQIWLALVIMGPTSSVVNTNGVVLDLDVSLTTLLSGLQLNS